MELLAGQLPLGQGQARVAILGGLKVTSSNFKNRFGAEGAKCPVWGLDACGKRLPCRHAVLGQAVAGV